jgi:hypothetical protein
MTPHILQPLLNAIVGAQCSGDPIVWHEAARRFAAIDRQLPGLPMEQRWTIEQELFELLPSDWPLWMEALNESAAATRH